MPIEFRILVERVLDEPGVKAAVEDLIRRKKGGEELERGPRIPPISSFLQRELDRLSLLPGPPAIHTSPHALDVIFRQCLIDVYGPVIHADPPDRSQK